MIPTQQDEDEPPNWLKDPKTWPDITDLTLSGLGIDVEGAKIRHSRLLPPEITSERVGRYPLPANRPDLEAIARTGIYDDDGTTQGTYVRRCRKKLENFGANKVIRRVTMDRSKLVVKEVRAIAKARQDADQELARLQKAVSVVRTTMLETSQEFDTGFGMIARAFNRNEVLPNGETVTVKSLISAYKNFYDHMHKLGGPITDDMAEEAEEAVFAKAMEASRDRIQRTLRTAIPITATEVVDVCAVAHEVKPQSTPIGGVVRGGEELVEAEVVG